MAAQTGRTGFNQSDCAVSRADSVQVSLGADAQSRSHGLPGGLQLLHSPLGLLHMLKVLEGGRWGKIAQSEIFASLSSIEWR